MTKGIKIIDVIRKNKVKHLINNKNKLHNLVDEKTILISALEGCWYYQFPCKI